jgi:hypothetical protein
VEGVEADDHTLCQLVYEAINKAVLRNPKFIMNGIGVGEAVLARLPDDSSHKGRSLLSALLNECKGALGKASDKELISNMDHYLQLMVRGGDNRL